MLHLTAAVMGGLIFAIAASAAFVVAARTTAGEAETRKLKEAAGREFEGAKPALIHAADTEIDKLPEDVDIAAIETKAQAVLTALFTRLLAANPLLAGSAGLLIGLIPFAFKALPTTLSTGDYKTRLKDEIQKLITEAKI